MSKSSTKSSDVGSCIKLETGSLIYACVSLLIFTAVAILFIVWWVMGSIAIAKHFNSDKRYSPELETIMAVNAIHTSGFLAYLLSIMVIAVTFTIILIKGLVTKNSHLVKAYFVYGVTTNTFTVIFALFVTLAILIHVGLIILLVCFLYSLILMMIKKTYLKLARAEHEESRNKKAVLEKTVSIRL